jgi:hypothetical protein
VVFGEHSLKTAEALQNLATILDAQGHAREAEDYLMKALAIEDEVICLALFSSVLGGLTLSFLHTTVKISQCALLGFRSAGGIAWRAA